MKTRLLLATVVAAGLLSLAYAYVQTDAQARDDVAKAIQAQKQAYIAAYSKGDLDGVLAVYAPDAEYIDSDGIVTRGTAELREMYKASLEEMKGWKLKVEGKSLRLIRPDVAVIDGIVELDSPEGQKQASNYTSIWVKQDGRWLVSSIRDLGSTEPESTVDGQAMLKELEWLVGEWTQQDATSSVTLSVRRDLGHFLALDYTIKQGDSTMQVRQFIGFDPREETLRSWVMDSTGGFGYSVWNKRGKTWRSLTTGVLPNGAEGTSVNSIRMIDNNSFYWRSEDRTVDGNLLPDVEVKFTRVAK